MGGAGEHGRVESGAGLGYGIRIFRVGESVTGEFTSDGARLRYHVEGTGGPTVLVHPGGPGYEWTAARCPGLERHLTVVYLEPVGTGGSERLADASGYRLSRYSQDIEALRRHLGVERPWLMGHSHGGWVAQVHALRYPGTLAGLVLWSTSARADIEVFEAGAQARRTWAGEPWYADAMAAEAEQTGVQDDDAITAIFRRQAGFYFGEYTARRGELDGFVRTVRIALAPLGGFLDEAAAFDTRPELPSLDLPTLVVVGAADAVLPARFSREIAGLVPGARLEVIPDAGHLVHAEQPAAFARVVASFILGH
ncbi:MAG TPA: alpha/beta hydrolase [Myxococcota bacterium]|nr:alpha/beta hydrolase [Myxococcota bacterium]